MKDKYVSPLFTNIYIPSIALCIAEKKYRRTDIVLYYETNSNKLVYCCSKSISYYGIKHSLSLNFVKNLVDNFLPLDINHFLIEVNDVKQKILEKIKQYSFSFFEIPALTIEPENIDSYSLIADFTGCQLLYKPIYVSLDLIFKSIAKTLKPLPISFIISDSFSFSLFSPIGLNIRLDKNLIVNFLKSEQFLRFIRIAKIIYPIKFFEEVGLNYFYDFAKLPLKFQDKILSLAINSSHLSDQIKLANRFRPLLLPFSSIQNLGKLDFFIFKILKIIFDKDQNKKYEISIYFSPPTNDKKKILTEIRKKLYIEAVFLKDYWLYSKSKSITSVIEYSNNSLDRFSILFEEKDIFSFFKTISQQIISNIKTKCSICNLKIEFDKKSCEELFENNQNDQTEKLLLLFDHLTKKFGEDKIHLAI